MGGGLLTNKGGCVLTRFKVSLLDKGGGGVDKVCLLDKGARMGVVDKVCFLFIHCRLLIIFRWSGNTVLCCH